MENQSSSEPITSSQQSTETQFKSEASSVPLVDSRPKANNFLVVLLSILLFISLSIAAFFAYQTQKLVADLTDYREQVKQTPIAIETSDPTTGWKTYTNTKYKFEVKQPKDTMIGYFDVRSGLFSDPNGEENQIDILLESQTELFKRFIQIEVTDSVMYKKSLFNAVNDTYNQQKEHFQTTNISQVNPVKFLNFDGYEYTFSGQAIYALGWGGVVEKGDYRVRVFQKDGYYFAFYSRVDKTLDQILSTFKFTDTESIVNWKTYTDEMNRFSFRYPIDVEIKNENGRLSMILSGLDYPVSIIPDGPHNWGEGMTKDQLDKIYMKQFQYPDDPVRKMYPDTDVQFVIEFLTLDDKNKALTSLSMIDQILST
jgi:hypothetical protein